MAAFKYNPNNKELVVSAYTPLYLDNKKYEKLLTKYFRDPDDIISKLFGEYEDDNVSEYEGNETDSGSLDERIEELIRDYPEVDSITPPAATQPRRIPTIEEIFSKPKQSNSDSGTSTSPEINTPSSSEESETPAVEETRTNENATTSPTQPAQTTPSATPPSSSTAPSSSPAVTAQDIKASNYNLKSPLGRTQYLMDILMSKLKLSRAAAAGIVGNLYYESTGLLPTKIGDRGKAHGIALWHAPRRVGKNILKMTFELQVEYLIWELLNEETWNARGGLTRLRKFKTPESAAAFVDAYYERSDLKATAIRLKFARQIYDTGIVKGALGGTLQLLDRIKAFRSHKVKE